MPQFLRTLGTRLLGATLPQERLYLSDRKKHGSRSISTVRFRESQGINEDPQHCMSARKQVKLTVSHMHDDSHGTCIQCTMRIAAPYPDNPRALNTGLAFRARVPGSSNEAPTRASKAGRFFAFDNWQDMAR